LKGPSLFPKTNPRLQPRLEPVCPSQERDEQTKGVRRDLNNILKK
jgi:Holliday junction resolvase RusA-like endonuclease